MRGLLLPFGFGAALTFAFGVGMPFEVAWGCTFDFFEVDLLLEVVHAEICVLGLFLAVWARL